MTKTKRPEKVVAEKTRSAYSFGLSYGIREWTRIAKFLLDEGYGPDATEQILYSKYMRWAHDNSNNSAKMTLEKFIPYFRKEQKGIDKMLEEFGLSYGSKTEVVWYL